MKEYCVYGLRIHSDYSFQYVPSQGISRNADLVFTCDDQRLPPPVPQNLSGQFLTPAGNVFLEFYQNADGFRLSYPGIADFTVAGDRIECYPAQEADLRLVEDCFLSSVATFWLELHGMRGMHASAAAIDGRVVGFMGNSGHGKSSLASGFLAAGYPLLSDDILAVEANAKGFQARPGYPRLRLWQEQAYDLGLAPAPSAGREKLELAVGAGQWGAFCAETLPLSRLYVLERRLPTDPSEAVILTPIPQRDAVIELVRFSFLPRLTAAAGMQAERLAFFTKMAGRVPVCKLSYPTGVVYLPAVVERIVADADGGGLTGEWID